MNSSPPSHARLNARIALLTFGILALELALIRWSSGQIRVFAYFNNLVLIGAFLGLGVGAAYGRRRGSRLAATLPVLVAIAVPFALAEPLGLVHMSFPDPAISLWGGERLSTSSLPGWANLSILLALWAGLVVVFGLAGTELGALFAAARARSLDAYAADLAGSLAGVVAFTVVMFANAPPPVWLALGATPFALLHRRPLGFASLVAVCGLAWYSTGAGIYSPYNRIDLITETPTGHMMLQVNRDFHQLIRDLGDAHLDTLPPERAGTERHARAVYDLPFRLRPDAGSALVVGAGTGNDAAAALRHRVARVVAVDIDPQIIELGRRLHPERPYTSGAQTVVDDARAFLASYTGEPFDVIAYGLLDSHAMVSTMSTLRVDNFVYTEEGLRAAWRHLDEDGVLVLSFSLFAGSWVADRLYWTLHRATGVEPVALFHAMHWGASFVVTRDRSVREAAMRTGFKPLAVAAPESVRTTSDDWPFLYLRPHTFPTLYVAALAVVLIAAALSVPLAFGGAGRGFDPAMFALGAGFLLLETRGVTALSLLFGSTWLVNAAVFGGILLMALLATLLVRDRTLTDPQPWFVGLVFACLALWAFDLGVLNQLPFALRGITGGIAHAVPLFFAGVVMPILLARSADPAAALGSNLLGAVLGGCMEYFSMLVGLQAVVLLAAVFYLIAYLAWRRSCVAPSDGAPARVP